MTDKTPSAGEATKEQAERAKQLWHDIQHDSKCWVDDAWETVPVDVVIEARIATVLAAVTKAAREEALEQAAQRAERYCCGCCCNEAHVGKQHLEPGERQCAGYMPEGLATTIRALRGGN